MYKLKSTSSTWTAGNLDGGSEELDSNMQGYCAHRWPLCLVTVAKEDYCEEILKCVICLAEIPVQLSVLQIMACTM